MRQLLDNAIPATFINSSLELGEIARRTAGLLKGHYKLPYVIFHDATLRDAEP